MRANLLDKLVLWVNPQQGAVRLAARARATMLQSAFDGASPSHRNASRRYRAGDANSAVLSGAKRLRYAARDLERNQPLAARGISVLAANVIGAGVIPSVSGVRGQRSRDALQRLVNEHCDRPNVDAAGRQNLYGLQATAFKAAVRDGEALMVRRRAMASERLPLPFQISVLEADFLDDRVHGPLSGGNVAIEGIEFNANGRAVAYHLYDHHPGDTTRFSSLNSTRYPASDVVHLYRIDRPGQAKGVSWLAPVMVRLADFEEVKDAYILRQKIAACFAVFVKKSVAAGDPTDVGAGDRSKAGTRLETVEPGLIEYLDAGEDVEFGSPPAVTDLEPFFRVNGRDIAVGLGMTYEALTGDLSNVNFSSGRMGWLEFHRNIDQWTEDMVKAQMCWKIGQWIFEGLSLVIAMPAGVGIDWTPPRREMIDPASELKAAAQAARDGLGSRSQWLRSRGFDPETVDQERADEIARERTLGLAYDTNVSQKAATPEPAGATQPDTTSKGA
jgi:lambda family phage portal protein